MGSGDKVNFAFIEKQLKAFEKLDIHPTTFIIDDGWENKPGDWLSVNQEKFPQGLEEITRLIKANKMEPWLWVQPFHTSKSSELAKNHPDWLVQKKGQPISFWLKNTSAGSPHYLLDARNNEVINYFEEVAKKVKNWGFEGVKLDFLSSLYVIPNIDKKEAQHLTHKTMEIFKEKGLTILASGCPFNAGVGVADFIRLSSDSGLPFLPDNMRGKLANKYFVKHHLKGVKDNRRLVSKFINIDPDMYYSTSVSEKDKQRLKEAQKLSLYRAGCLTLGDDFSKLSTNDAETIKELIKKFDRAQHWREFVTSKRIAPKF